MYAPADQQAHITKGSTFASRAYRISGEAKSQSDNCPHMLITPDDFMDITGEELPEEFELLYDMAVAVLEKFCSRPLEERVTYEVVEVYSDMKAWVSATPITHVENGYQHNSDFILVSETGLVELNYTGGYGPYGSPHPAACPKALAIAVCRAISTLADPDAMVDTSTSMSVAGEYSVSRQSGVVISADGTPIASHLLPFASIGGVSLLMASPYRRV